MTVGYEVALVSDPLPTVTNEDTMAVYVSTDVDSKYPSAAIVTSVSKDKIQLSITALSTCPGANTIPRDVKAVSRNVEEES